MDRGPPLFQVGYISYARDIPVKRAQEAELWLLAGNVSDAEGILIQAGTVPPDPRLLSFFLRRASMMEIHALFMINICMLTR